MADCPHSQHWSLDQCPGLTEAEIEFGIKVRSCSIGFHASEGRDQWHGDCVKTQVDEMFANAKRYGNPEPQYEGRAVLR